MKSVSNIIPLAKKSVQADREDLAFLPAALEIVETPASPNGRAIAWTIMAVFCAALLWASVSEVDIVATAMGRIIPSGKTKQIQPFEAGVVRAIHVTDGQQVKAGEVLIELDPTLNQADINHLEGDLVMSELDVARLRAALTDNGDPIASFYPPQGSALDMVAVQRRLLLNQIEEQRAKLSTIDRQTSQKQAERETIAAKIDKLKATLPILEERLQIRKTLFEHDTGSKANYLELLQSLVDQQKELAVEKSQLQESEAALAANIQTREQAIAEYRRTHYTELLEAERKASGLREDLVKARQKTRLQQLTSPVDGTIQQLAIHTVGGVVTPAQLLMVVVPADSQLQIEAMVTNRDIGFVQVGQDAQIKVDTFNFTRYGLLHGKVLNVSRDAIIRDKPQDRSNDQAKGSEVESSEPKGQEMNYAARVSIDRIQMQIDDRMVDLTPGMAVTVEIKTGSRRVMTYLLSPLLKFKQESLRER